MYLSRVEIDKKNRHVAKELTHLGAYHNWVETSFPKEFQQGIRSRKLWRIDPIGEKTYLLILSEEMPDRDALEKYGVAGTAETKDYDPFLESLKNGQKCKFRFVFNPTVSLSDSNNPSKRGRVVPLTDEVSQRDYLLKRAEKHGFHLEAEDFYLLNSSFEPVRKESERKIDLVKAEMQGILTITDRDKFLELLTTGLGRKKAYGFGLMTVIPL